MIMTFTATHELDVDIEGMLRNINKCMNETIEDYLAGDNTVVEYFSEQDTEKLLNEITPKIRKILIDKLAQM